MNARDRRGIPRARGEEVLMSQSMTLQATELSMSLGEARRVPWLRNNPRPIGELYDEGYLTLELLTWASVYAYNEKLKTAAAVLLTEMETRPPVPDEPAPQEPPAEEGGPVVQTSLTMQEARQTIWPFNRYKGRAMGPLVDARHLSLKDLVFAVENAWDKRVREAAALFIAQRLQQAIREPATSAGPLQVVSAGRSYSEKRQYQLTLLAGTWRGFVLGAAILTVAALVLNILTDTSKSYLEIFAEPGAWLALGILIVLFAVTLGFLAWQVKLTSKTIDEKIETHRKGEEGEDKIVEAMRQNLNGDWTLFRNVVLPGKGGDLDAVLVGPPGVWVLEIKNYSGHWQNVGEQWQYRDKKGWQPYKKSPSQQANKNAAALRNFLQANGVQQWIYPAVVWANPDTPLQARNVMVPVWQYNLIDEELGNLWQNKPLSPTHLEAIKSKLEALVTDNAAQT